MSKIKLVAMDLDNNTLRQRETDFKTTQKKF